MRGLSPSPCLARPPRVLASYAHTFPLRTDGELDVLFEQRVDARRFATTDVDQFADSEHSAVANAAVKNKAEGDIAHVEQL